MAFRFTYETKYRTRWDQNESTEQGLILRIEAQDLHALPYDLLQAGRHLTFTLGHLFPTLSALVVAALGRSEFDALFRAQHQHRPGKLGDNSTKDFLLQHVFDVTPELLKEPSELLRVLLSNPGIVFSREALLSNVWKDDTFVTVRSVDTLVKRIRKKIEEDPAGPAIILTVWGAGYKAADV